MDSLTYVNGLWHPCYKFSKDLGLYRAQGVVEVLEGRGSVFFCWDDHYERLLKSCGAYEYLSIEKLPSKEEIIRHFAMLSKPSDQYVARILVTPGDSKDSKTPSGGQTLTIDVFDFPEARTTPFKLKTINATRAFPQFKRTASYGDVPIYEASVKKQGFDKFLYWSPSWGILEGGYENIFFKTTNGELLVPNTDILNGITREVVLEIAEKSGMFKKIILRPVHLYQLDLCDECFITSTTLRVAAVESINDPKDHSFKVFPKNLYTQKLQTLFQEYRENYYKSRGA